MRALILAFIAVPAFATNVPADPKQDQSQNQGQSQEATGGYAEATGGDNSFAYSQRRQAPAISAPPVYASGPCAVGASGGISTPVGGISGGKVVESESCNRRELARVLTPLNPALALKLLCADPLLAGIASESECTYAKQPEKPAEPPVVVNVAPAVVPRETSCATPESVTAAFKACVAK